MKKKIIFCMLLCIMLWSMTGCRKTNGEADNPKTQQTEKQETDNLTTQETKAQGAGNSTKQEGTESMLGNDRNDATRSDADPTEEYIKYKIEDYGTVEEKRQEYQEHETERIAYYYEMENFFLHDTLQNADVINQTLREIYDEHEKSYQDGAEEYRNGMYGAETEEFPTEYDLWHLLSLTYIGDDLDFYLTDSFVVFFYRYPGFWDDVVLPRP
ncbi:MAG: hypothetical protein NC251_09840 [Lachnoclostridium sp.]|nr:hypothetical protein [Lachnospira sp.]MCM1248721.1 hypothetical protein [Lachnoclostridium sp.]